MRRERTNDGRNQHADDARDGDIGRLYGLTSLRLFADERQQPDGGGGHERAYGLLRSFVERGTVRSGDGVRIGVDIRLRVQHDQPHGFMSGIDDDSAAINRCMGRRGKPVLTNPGPTGSATPDELD